MQTSDKKRFLTVLTGVADYYKQELSPGVIALYWQGLKQFDIDAVEKLFWDHTQNPDNGQFMPKIADLTRGMQGRTQDQAALAWAKVDNAVRRVGNYQDVVFDDALIHRVVAEMGGWIWFGQQLEDEWPFIAKRFENMYRGYRVRAETPEYQPVLIGICSAQNQKEGFQSQAPILIGNAEKAKQVMRLGVNKPVLGIQQMDPQEAANTLRLIDGRDGTNAVH
jgi:hypothetical protein